MKEQSNSKIEYLYLHVPFCKHLCNYCDFYKHSFDLNQVEQFEKYLDQTFDSHSSLLDKYGKKLSNLKSMYLGGGTPSLWDGASFLKSKLEHFLTIDTEFTLELDPGSWAEKSFYNWKELGVNRISIGTQSMDQKFIEIMDRSHNINETVKTLNFIRKNISNYSVDFMLGLPYSHTKKRNIIDELKMLLDFEPTHLSLYILKTRKNYTHLENLPPDEYVEEEYFKVCDYLESVGYCQYEISNFSKEKYQSIHNKSYWNYNSVAALGPSATGLLNIDDKAVRYKWKPLTYEFIEEKLTPNDILLEKVFLNLRCNIGLDPNLIPAHKKELTDLLNGWKSRSLGDWRDSHFCLNSRGYIIQDSLLDELFNKIPF